MKERPILFSGEMVRAILDGRKTQTRRVVKFDWCGSANGLLHQASFDPAYKCPYGKVGDRLWVRETWAKLLSGRIWYRADGHSINDGGWRPSIHMPRWASRITLEITGVWVERLQAIGQNDAFREGVRRAADGRWFNYAPDGPTHNSARGSFISLWESINGPGSWDANPWVWVIEFKRIQP